MDALLDIVGALKLTGGIFLDAEFTAPWCVAARVGPEDCSPVGPPPHSIIAYHYVSTGRLVLQVGAQTPIEAMAGDVIVLPRNDAHTLASAIGLTAVSADELVQPAESGLPRIVHGGGGEQTRVLCGFLGGDRQCELVTALLPAVLKLSVADGASGQWIESSLRFAADELSAGPGQSTAIVARLAGLLFLEAVRRHLGSLPADQGGWSAGLRDPVVGRALALLHGIRSAAGPPKISPARSVCRDRPWPSGSPNSSASRRCATWQLRASTPPPGAWPNPATPSPGSPSRRAMSPRPPSTAPSSASSASPPPPGAASRRANSQQALTPVRRVPAA
jgi:hypothetical protein